MKRQLEQLYYKLKKRKEERKLVKKQLSAKLFFKFFFCFVFLSFWISFLRDNVMLLGRFVFVYLLTCLSSSRIRNAWLNRFFSEFFSSTIPVSPNAKLSITFLQTSSVLLFPGTELQMACVILFFTLIFALPLCFS